MLASTVYVDGEDASHLRIGDRADLVIVDPDRLRFDTGCYAEESVEQYMWTISDGEPQTTTR